MVTGLPGACSDSVPRVAEEVLSTECEHATARHQQMGEEIVKGLLNSRWSVIHLHVRVNSLSKKYTNGLTQ